MLLPDHFFPTTNDDDDTPTDTDDDDYDYDYLIQLIKQIDDDPEEDAAGG